jgi:hypothetical protein
MLRRKLLAAALTAALCGGCTSQGQLDPTVGQVMLGVGAVALGAASIAADVYRPQPTVVVYCRYRWSC